MKYPDKHRFKGASPWGTNNGDKMGLFYITTKKGAPLKVLASTPDSEWQHVSVSLPHRCPTWKEMCMVKDLFWNDDETVVQFHPPKSEYVNNHSHCLHLWKHSFGHVTPPSELVGLK